VDGIVDVKARAMPRSPVGKHSICNSLFGPRRARKICDRLPQRERSAVHPLDISVFNDPSGLQLVGCWKFAST
jgi:hypothetical protein